MENWLQGMDGFSYCMEMLAAAFGFFIFLKKRNGFWIRMVISIGILFLGSLLIYPYFTDITNVYNWVWFIFIFGLIIVLCYFCCDIMWNDAIMGTPSTYSFLFVYCYFLPWNHSGVLRSKILGNVFMCLSCRSCFNSTEAA